MLVISWPRLQRRYAVEMMIRAVRADDSDLEASRLLNSAIDRVNRLEAQDEAVAILIPLLDAQNVHERLRARFCAAYLNGRSPQLIGALIAIYRNPVEPWSSRIEIAGMLEFISPQDAEQCGAGAVLKEYWGRGANSMSGEDQRRLAEKVLRRVSPHNSNAATEGRN